jgi:hypothetical protein
LHLAPVAPSQKKMTLADIEKQEEFLKKEKERLATEAKMKEEADALKKEIEEK